MARLKLTDLKVAKTRKPSAAQTTEEVGRLLRSGKITLLHFYSDF